MTSTSSDSGEQELLKSLTLPASQADAVSLCDKEAASVPGKSRHTAIEISDGEIDTEDEDDDVGQDFDDSQSCITPTTSIADYLDSTGTKHSLTGSEAAIGMDTTPAVSLALVEGDRLVTEATGATSEPGIVTIDAPPDEGSCHRAQSTPMSPLMRTYSPITAGPEEMAYTLLHDSVVCASPSRDEAIPGAHTSVRLSPESQ
ncbi:hypothetical protein ACHAO9_005866 [Fusarium lateritium]